MWTINFLQNKNWVANLICNHEKTAYKDVKNTHLNTMESRLFGTLKEKKKNGEQSMNWK